MEIPLKYSEHRLKNQEPKEDYQKGVYILTYDLEIKPKTEIKFNEATGEFEEIPIKETI